MAFIPKPHLFGFTPDALVEHLGERGVTLAPTFARKILSHTIAQNRPFAQLEGFMPKQAFNFLNVEGYARDMVTVHSRARDAGDGFVKYLFVHEDGEKTEAVRIPLEKPARFTVCLSSQVGCAMQCVFCATGRLGLTRNLAAAEIVATMQHIRAEAPGRVSGAVFMGQGEPFHNYPEVMRAAEVLSEPNGCRISKEAITISTVGLVPQIERFVSENRPYRLFVSLTSAHEDKRKQLLPIAGKFSMQAVRKALQGLHEMDGKRVTLAWVLMGGVNHDAAEVEAIRQAFSGLPIRVNIVDLNATDDGFRRATDVERDEFVDRLHAMGVATQRRYSGGRSKHAACGMLAALET